MASDPMTDEEVQAYVDEATEYLGEQPTMDPTQATQEQSIDYLEGIVQWARAGIQALRDDMRGPDAD